MQLEKNNSDFNSSSNSLYTELKKRLILGIVMSAGLVSLLAATILLTLLKPIQDDLKVSSSNLDAIISSGLFVSAIVPLFWGSFSDSYGRKPFYILSLLLLIIGSLILSISNKFWHLIVGRMVQVSGVSAAFVLAYGVIGDVFERERRGRAVGTFLIGPTIAPAIGPLLGGIVASNIGWRWAFGLITILSFLIIIQVILLLPETILAENKKPGPIIKNKNKLEIKLVNPFTPFLMLKEWNVVLILIYACVTYTPQLCSAAILAIILPKYYELTPTQLGLTYISAGVGDAFGSTLGGKMADYFLSKAKEKNPEKEPSAESRLRGLWLGSILMILGLGLNGWFIHFRLPLWAVLITQFLTGMATLISISGTTTYLVDLYPSKTASTYAIGSFAKHLVASVVVFFDSKLLDLLGVAGLYSLFSFCNFLVLGILLILELYGENMRKK